MSTNYRISVPQPCSEDWNKMIPEEKGRFCKSCEKIVVDFRSFSKDEIQEYFRKHFGEKICGRFKVNQLQSLTIEIPAQAIQQEKNPFRIFKFSLLMIFGTTLFSCSNEAGEKIKIEKVVVKDAEKTAKKTEYTEKVTDSAKVKQPKEIEIQVIEPPIELGGVVEPELIYPPEISGDIIAEYIETAPANKIYETCEVMEQPEFPELKSYIAQNLNFKPEDASFNSTCFVECVIRSNGKITDVNLKRGTVNEEFNNAAIALVKNMPEWKPGMLKGEKVDVKVILRIKP